MRKLRIAPEQPQGLTGHSIRWKNQRSCKKLYRKSDFRKGAGFNFFSETKLQQEGRNENSKKKSERKVRKRWISQETKGDSRKRKQ